MDKIYLASKSKARKVLLERFGFKFKILPSKVKEQSKRGHLSFSQLVKNNARNKAQEASSKVSGGIIIAADTICVQDGRIFGKPKNMRDARRMLKRLSSKPQWLYTGLAVIRKAKGKNKLILDYEKTKVCMDRLTLQQIDKYFKQVSPLDKAGSFDIQGKGAFFIKRIDGCFYNVVGLPLRKLYLMLKKLDLKFIFFFLPVCYLLTTLLCGCSTEYNLVTKQEEKYYYSTDREVQMGQSINRQIEKEYKPAEDPLMQKRVEDIGKKIAAVSDRKEIDYHFRVLDEDEVNAVSLPGGYVYIFSGLLDKISNDDELAGVLAHEVGHIVARHSIKKLQALQGYSILRVLVAVSPVPGSADVGTAADAAFMEFLLGYGREDELLADQLGARYAKLAGYNPQGMVTFLKKLQEINRRAPAQRYSYYKTHPYVPDRIRVVKQELGQKINFGDYINIEQTEHGDNKKEF